METSDLEDPSRDWVGLAFDSVRDKLRAEREIIWGRQGAAVEVCHSSRSLAELSLLVSKGILKEKGIGSQRLDG